MDQLLIRVATTGDLSLMTLSNSAKSDALSNACAHGHLQVLLMIQDTYGLAGIRVRDVLYHTCYGGHIHVLQ